MGGHGYSHVTRCKTSQAKRTEGGSKMQNKYKKVANKL